MRNEKEIRCRDCGAEIRIMRAGGYYGRVVVDAEPVWIRLERGGEAYITEDGRTVFGRMMGDADDDPDAECIEAFVPHKGKCKGREKKRRAAR